MFRSNIMPTLLHVLSCAREERLLRAAVGALEPMLVLLPRDAIAREVRLDALLRTGHAPARQRSRLRSGRRGLVSARLPLTPSRRPRL